MFLASRVPNHQASGPVTKCQPYGLAQTADALYDFSHYLLIIFHL